MIHTNLRKINHKRQRKKIPKPTKTKSPHSQFQIIPTMSIASLSNVRSYNLDQVITKLLKRWVNIKMMGKPRKRKNQKQMTKTKTRKRKRKTISLDLVTKIQMAKAKSKIKTSCRKRGRKMTRKMIKHWSMLLICPKTCV